MEWNGNAVRIFFIVLVALLTFMGTRIAVNESCSTSGDKEILAFVNSEHRAIDEKIYKNQQVTMTAVQAIQSSVAVIQNDVNHIKDKL